MDTFSAPDTAMMQTALNLAQQGRFSTSPNPRVGCVLVNNGKIVGQGFHIQAGGAHAEIHALRQAGERARGATAYVTLEPCSHTGRTGPCAQAFIDAGIARVVVAMADPNPLVSGQGFALLHAASIQVACGLMATEARELNRGFLSRFERGRPFVRLKIATSLDGKTALSNGDSQWITGTAARADVQILRAESCAVLTGIGTVLADNPQLNVRAFATLRQPVRVILDSNLRTPLSSRVMQDGNSTTLLVTTVADPDRHRSFLQQPHVSVLVAPAKHSGQIDLNALLPLLAERGIGELMVEAGATLSSALLATQQVDELVIYQAPKILGSGAQNAFRLPENPQALQHNGWQTHALTSIGDDIKWVLAPPH